MAKKIKRDYFVSCIVAAGGKGTRIGAGINKIFIELCGEPIIAHTLAVLQNNDYIDEIIIVTGECDIPGCCDIVKEFGITKVKTITAGGDTRQQSVMNGLKEISPGSDILIVHDGARPLVESSRITEVICAAKEYGAAALGTPEKNTLKFVDENGFITHTVDRSHIYEIHTPQGFKTCLARTMYENAINSGINGTDDCFLAESMGEKIRIVEDSGENIKITAPDDILVAERILENRS